jgi:hypothetical protein
MDKLKISDLKQAKGIALEKVSAIKPDLELRLHKRSENSESMGHGQIKRAARYTINKLGYRWVLGEDVEEKYVRMYLKLEVRCLVKCVVGAWHQNPSRVWLQFRNYCLEMAAATAAKEALKKFTISQ